MSKAFDPRGVGAWILVAIIVAIIGFSALFAYLGTALTASATVDLERALIQIDGLLMPFVGLAFTAMLAEIRHRSERASQADDRALVDKLSRRSSDLQRIAFGGFILLITSLAVSLGLLASSLAFPAVNNSLVTAFVVPFGLTVGGLGLIMITLATVAFD